MPRSIREMKLMNFIIVRSSRIDSRTFYCWGAEEGSIKVNKYFIVICWAIPYFFLLPPSERPTMKRRKEGIAVHKEKEIISEARVPIYM